MEESFDTFISGIYLGFCGTAGCDGLSLGLPVDRTTEPNEKAGHRPRFEEIKEGDRGVRTGLTCVLGAPVRVGKCTNRCGEGEVDVSRCGRGRAGGEGNAKRFAALEIADCILSCSDMTRGGAALVFSENVCDGGKVKPGATGQPVEMAHNVAEVSLGFVKNVGGKMRRGGYLVNWVTGTVGCTRRGLVREVK